MRAMKNEMGKSAEEFLVAFGETFAGGGG